MQLNHLASSPCVLVKLPLCKVDKETPRLNGLARPNPDDARPIVCRPMGLPITAGCNTALIRTRVSAVTPLALRCSALDRCATRQPNLPSLVHAHVLHAHWTRASLTVNKMLKSNLSYSIGCCVLCSANQTMGEKKKTYFMQYTTSGNSVSPYSMFVKTVLHKESMHISPVFSAL